MYSRLSDTASNLSVAWCRDMLAADGGKFAPAGGCTTTPAQAARALCRPRGQEFPAGGDSGQDTIQLTRYSERATLTVRHEYRTLCIRVQGVLDISAYAEFRACYETMPEARHYVVELSATRHIDSAGLAMLLLLHDHAGGDRDRISLLNPQRAVVAVLNDVNFDSLFRID